MEKSKVCLKRIDGDSDFDGNLSKLKTVRAFFGLRTDTRHSDLYCTDRLVVILVHGDSEKVVEIFLQLLLPGVHLVRLQHHVGPLGEPRQGGSPTPAAAARGQLPLSFLLGLKFKIQGQMLVHRSRNFSVQ